MRKEPADQKILLTVCPCMSTMREHEVYDSLLMFAALGLKLGAYRSALTF